jgi:lipopolysaccharide export system permease protein
MVDNANRSVIAAGLEAGRFTELPGGNGVIYTQELSPDGQHLTRVFVASEHARPGVAPEVNLVTAARGKMFIDPQSGDRFLALFDGHRYSGVLGQSNWRLLDYRRNDLSLTSINTSVDDAGAGAPHEQTTLTLLRSRAPADRAELAWRIAAPASVLVLALLALPLARQNPREPFYGRLLLAVLAYLVFANTLGIGRAEIMAGRSVGAWLMALIEFAIALFALLWFRRQHSEHRARGARA